MFKCERCGKLGAYIFVPRVCNKCFNELMQDPLALLAFINHIPLKKENENKKTADERAEQTA